jgi:hypothetical protein
MVTREDRFHYEENSLRHNDPFFVGDTVNGDGDAPTTVCWTCPQSGLCPVNTAATVATTLPQPGFWFDEHKRRGEFFACPYPELCDVDANGEHCPEGHVVPLCAVCAPQYGRAGDQAVCTRCGNFALAAVLLFGSLCFKFGFFGYLVRTSIVRSAESYPCAAFSLRSPARAHNSHDNCARQPL